MNRSLDVYLGSALAGKLRQVADDSIFQYEPDYLTTSAPIPLSQSLPLRREPFAPEVSRQFFANLLPEGAVRDFVARRHGLSPDNEFALLAAVGGDCAGAVALYPEGERGSASPRYRPLSRQELEQLSAEPFVAAPSFLSADALRLSLAGAQDKLPVAVMAGKICLPEGGAPSTHILKPRPPRFRSLPENEMFCMRLAARVGLTVPATALLPEGDGFFLIERYDRQREADGPVRRIHQEDFCQALAVSPARKYEAEGGPGFAACFDLLRCSRQPLPDRQRLIRWAVFNYLLGNADAHAKNISLLYDRPAPTLSPFYDLVCTAVYPLSSQFAMAVGGVYDPRLLDLASWLEFTRQTGERRGTFVLQTLEEMARTLPREGAKVLAELTESYGAAEIYGQIAEVLQQRATGVLRMLAAG